MCDYSLLGVASRLAVQGDELVTFRFPTGSIGLADLKDVNGRSGATAQSGFWSALRDYYGDYYCAPPENVIHAVCVPPGARLRLQNLPLTVQQNLEITSCEDGTLTQLSAEAFRYRDAVRFRNGWELLLQRLGEGVRVRVIGLVDTAEVAIDAAELRGLGETGCTTHACDP